MTWIEGFAVFFGILCVALTIRQNIWCWPTGLIQVSLYVYIFSSVRLYSDVVLHVFYIGLQLYGWHHWLHGGKDQTELRVSRLSAGSLRNWITAVIAGTLLWGFGMSTLTNGSVPYPDAFTTVCSLCAQWLMVQKRVESWFFWIAVDLAAITIYFYKGLTLTAILYIVFLGMAIFGLLSWRRCLNAPSEINENGTHAG